jgi:hypothetical protein
MGRALASILEQVDQAKRTDELAPLLVADTTELPPEPTVRTLLEATGIDVDTAIAAARGDGDLFDDDDLGAEPLQAASVRLVEAVGAGERAGTTRYKVVVIRPGRAKGTGRRYYPPKMLEANAGNFGGVTAFFNHDDLPKILQRGHGSRDPRDVCGFLQPGTWWEGDYAEADDGKQGRKPGAVMGHLDLLTEAAERVDALPQAFALSICMDPTRIRVKRTDDGELAPCVEGIVPQSGSLDLITGEAGAGGRLLERLREAAESRYGSANADLSTVPDETLLEAARARPGVVAALRQADPPPPPEPEDDDVDLTKLVEAVTSDPAAAAQLAEALADTPAITALVEAKVAEREDEIREDATAEGRRDLDLRDMRDEATRLIEARATGAGGILTPAFIDDLRSRYSLRDGRHPTPALDVYDQLDDQGAVTKSAMDRLREAVAVDIQREEGKLRESNPTRVRDLPPPAPDAGGDNGGGGEPPPPPKDPMSDRLGLDPERVRTYQGV